MPFGTEAQVPQRPDLAVIGVVTKMAPFKKSETPGSVFFSSELELEAKTAGGKNASFWLTVIPQYFTSDFDPNAFSGAERGTPGSGIYHVYRNNIVKFNKDRDGEKHPAAALQILTGPEGFKVVEEFANRYTVAAPPSLEDLYHVLAALVVRKDAKGNPAPVGYVLQQEKDDDGELQDRYRVSYFFPATKEGLEALTKSAGSKRRKRPLLLTWEK